MFSIFFFNQIQSKTHRYSPTTCSLVLTWRKCSNALGNGRLQLQRRRRSANSLFSRCATVRCLTTTGKITERLEAEAQDARRSRQSAGSDAAAAGSELGRRGGVVGRRAVGRRALGAVAHAVDDGGDICVWDGASCPRAPGPTRPAAAAAAPTGACLSGWWALARLWRDNSLDAASSRRPSAGCGGRRGSTGSSSFCAARRCASGASTSDGGVLVGQPSIGPPPPPPPRLRAVSGTLHSLLDTGGVAACVAGSARLPSPDVVVCINSGMGTLPHRWLRRGSRLSTRFSASAHRHYSAASTGTRLRARRRCSLFSAPKCCFRTPHPTRWPTPCPSSSSRLRTCQRVPARAQTPTPTPTHSRSSLRALPLPPRSRLAGASGRAAGTAAVRGG